MKKTMKQIVGDAIWVWAKENLPRSRNNFGSVHENGSVELSPTGSFIGFSNSGNYRKGSMKGVLEEVWEEFDDLAENTSGCPLWKNDNIPKFPFRKVCYSKDGKRLTLRNTPGKVSRLELMEGLRECLRLSISWAHVDRLMQTMNSRVPRGKGVGSKETLSKCTFVSVMWPYISKRVLKRMQQEPYYEEIGSPGSHVSKNRSFEAKPLNALSMQTALTKDSGSIYNDSGEYRDSYAQAQEEEKSSGSLNQLSVVEDADL